jgi:hypothetical protein
LNRLTLTTLLTILICHSWQTPLNGQVQLKATEQAAGKLLDAAEKCRPSNVKPYWPEIIEANLNAGRFKAALALMKQDALEDPTPRLVLAIRKYAGAMARAGRADEVDADLAFFKNNKLVRDWLAKDPKANELKEIYSRSVLLGTALLDADQGNLDGAIKKGGFEGVIRHLFNEGNHAAAVQTVKIHAGDDIEKMQRSVHLFWGTSKTFDLMMAKQHPTLASKIVEAWNNRIEGDKKVRLETFRQIAEIVTPEMRREIEIAALAGDYLPVEYQNRIVAHFLQQFPVEDSDALWRKTYKVFRHLLRNNKLKDAVKLFNSVSRRHASFLDGMELAERLFNSGDQRAAVGILERVLEMHTEKKKTMRPDFVLNPKWGRALKIGKPEAAAEFLKLSPVDAKNQTIVEMHQKVRDSGFSSAKSVVDPIKTHWASLVGPSEHEYLDDSERWLRDSMLWEHLLAELAIRKDSTAAYEATLALPKSIVGDPVEIGFVIKALIARGQDQKAIAYAKCWQDSPTGSFCLGDSFFDTFSVAEVTYKIKPNTKLEIFQAIGDKLNSDWPYLDHCVLEALKKKEKAEALRLAKISLSQGGSVYAPEFTKLNWHEDLIELAKKTDDPDDLNELVWDISRALFELRRIDELILHLEKYVPLFDRDHPVRFDSLVGYAVQAKDLFGYRR